MTPTSCREHLCCLSGLPNEQVGNGLNVSLQAIETLVFDGLREELANPEAVAEYVRTYNAAGAWPRRAATARSICSATTASSTAKSIG